MQQASQVTEPVRLDKWLWAARFYKTRSIARTMIDGGKVHYNGQRTKPENWSKTARLSSCVREMMNGQSACWGSRTSA